MSDDQGSPCEKPQAEPRARVVAVDPSRSGYSQILGGPPETVTMHSGCVVLLPSESVGKHTTGQHEEAIVVLEGSGEMRLSDGSVLHLEPHSVAYCPPQTEHDMINTGSGPFRYIYIVARAT